MFTFGCHELVSAAHAFALAAHTSIDQRRKYTGEPYIIHPEWVAERVMRVPGSTPEMVAAALLHDVIEDVPWVANQRHIIADQFGQRVGYLVDGLTDIAKLSDGRRAVRVAINRQHIKDGDNDVKTIKCADLLHNSISIMANDRGFAPIYMAEKRMLLEDALIGAEASIYAEAKAVVDDFFAMIGPKPSSE